jgi:P4 family phage/plasmid primase-like protien
MTEVSLNTPEDYALYYLREFGVSVFIIKSDPPADRKKPAVKWDLYKIMRPSQKQLERWFAKNPNYNVAVATGNISNNIIGFDVDGPTAKKRVEERRPEMSTNLRVAFDNTMVNRTGSGGAHIIFRLDEPTGISQKVIWSDEQAHSQILMQGNGHYLVMPPSRHPNGNHYEWNGNAPHLITQQELYEFIRLVGSQSMRERYSHTAVGSAQSKENNNNNVSESQTTTAAAEGPSRTLNPEQMQELLSWVKPFYTPGNRDHIVFYLSGMMRKANFSLETARRFISLLGNASEYSDENLDKSLTVVDNTYRKPLNELNGKSGLHDLLVTSFETNDEYDSEQHQQRIEAFSQICQMINGDPPPTSGERPTTSSSAGGGEEEQEETKKETKVRGLAEKLEEKYHFASMEDTEELFHYSEKNGRYEPAEPLVKAELEILQPGVITDTVTNVIQKLVRRHLAKREAFDNDLYIWNMANGLYDIRTNTLREHDWRYLSRKQIPVKFDPKARPKKFGKFLSEVLYPNQIRTAVESMAYTLLRDNPFEIYVILLGFGSNGKSVLMYVLIKLHGEDNVSSTSLADLLSNRFAMKELEGKNVNIDMEMSRATIDDMSVLKELTGSQPIRIEPKYMQAYTTRLWAKHYFSTNEMPEMRDYSDAHYRREVIISFPKQFIDGVNANPSLKHELTTDEELSGIFNALMIPLRRIALEHKPPYMDAKTIQERKLKHELIFDPIKAFLDAVTEPTDYENEEGIPKEELHLAYEKFCAFYKLPIQRYDPFCKAVKARGVKDGRETSSKGERRRVWEGIRLKKYLFEDTLTV